MKTLVPVAHTGTTAHIIEIDHVLPMSDAWLTLNSQAPEGKMWSNGELVDAAECCDADYRCSYPPCVAESEKDAAYYGAMFAAAHRAQSDEYAVNDPKHPEFAERVFEGVGV